MNELELEISQLYDFKAKGAHIRSSIQVLKKERKTQNILSI